MVTDKRGSANIEMKVRTVQSPRNAARGWFATGASFVTPVSFQVGQSSIAKVAVTIKPG
jgi:hypothetical protein